MATRSGPDDIAEVIERLTERIERLERPTQKLKLGQWEIDASGVSLIVTNVVTGVSTTIA